MSPIILTFKLFEYKLQIINESLISARKRNGWLDFLYFLFLKFFKLSQLQFPQIFNNFQEFLAGSKKSTCLMYEN